jgi:acetyl esterase/lipase
VKSSIALPLSRWAASVSGVLFLSLLGSFPLTAQDAPGKPPIPRDNYFTLESATEKAQKEYPFATPVSSEVPADVEAYENTVYVSYGDRDLHLDLYRPKGRTDVVLPAVLFVHGGGWRSGDRTMERPMVQRVAEAGYVTATVEYRLTPEAIYPSAVYDLKEAVRWMRAHASRFRIDTMHIAIGGCSAGAQLASLIGTTNRIARFEGVAGSYGHSSDIQAIINIDGYMDFTRSKVRDGDTDPAKPSSEGRWLGGSYRERPDLWREASPITYITDRTPPILFLNSSQDWYHAGRDEAIAKLQASGVYYEMHVISGTPHTFWLFHPWFEPASDHVVQFLDRVLKGKRQ